MFARRIVRFVAILAAVIICTSLCARAQVAPPLAPGVSIVLPPRLVANAPATLAVLGLDGHLVPDITVQVSFAPDAQAAPQYVTTDATGRATFSAAAGGAVISQAAGASAAALLDPGLPPANAPTVTEPAVSLRDRFSVCGAGFSSQAAENRATADGDAMFVLAASPECVVVLAQSRTLYGPAKIEIDSGQAHLSATTSLVALDFSPPDPPLTPGMESLLTVRADGTPTVLRLLIENRSTNVLAFAGGDTQLASTSGGTPNQAQVKVKAIRSGDFSFYARLLAPPDTVSAARYLTVAAAMLSKNQRGALNKLAAQLARNPDQKHIAEAARDLDRIAIAIPPSPLRTLIDAARTAIQ